MSGKPDQYRLETLYFCNFPGWGLDPLSPNFDPLIKSKPVLMTSSKLLTNINNWPWSPAGKGLTSWLSFVVSSVSLSLSHWYPGSGVVLDCIDS